MSKDFGSPRRLLRRHPTVACVCASLRDTWIAGYVGRHSLDRFGSGNYFELHNFNDKWFSVAVPHFAQVFEARMSSSPLRNSNSNLL